MPATEPSPAHPQLSVIIPARNEEASFGACLESLVSQTGVNFEIIAVNDHSTDRTREIAASFPNVRIIEAGPLPPGWTGKNNAVATGARQARGQWLLFTDADTVHLPGSLARALAEAKEHHADMLSYSPEQIAVTFWEMAVLPVVFAELARQYPPSKVSDPKSSEAAANGQFILIRHETYDAIGGHAAVASDILEDVALARRVKSSGRKLRFRYAAEAVRTRMYRNFTQLREGWTKNLALLFPNPGRLAMKSMVLWTLAWAVLLIPALANLAVSFPPDDPLLKSRTLSLIAGILHSWLDGFTILPLMFLPMRLRGSNFTWDRELLGGWFGMPMFAYLLLRSKRAHASHKVSWKGRNYEGKDQPPNKNLEPTPIPAGKTL